MDNESLREILELQRKYDELQADCKDLLNYVINVVQGSGSCLLVEFNDSEGFPAMILNLLSDTSADEIKNNNINGERFAEN